MASGKAWGFCWSSKEGIFHTTNIHVIFVSTVIENGQRAVNNKENWLPVCWYMRLLFIHQEKVPAFWSYGFIQHLNEALYSTIFYICKQGLLYPYNNSDGSPCLLTTYSGEQFSYALTVKATWVPAFMLSPPSIVSQNKPLFPCYRTPFCLLQLLPPLSSLTLCR